MPATRVKTSTGAPMPPNGPDSDTRGPEALPALRRVLTWILLLLLVYLMLPGPLSYIIIRGNLPVDGNSWFDQGLLTLFRPAQWLYENSAWYRSYIGIWHTLAR